MEERYDYRGNYTKGRGGVRASEGRGVCGEVKGEKVVRGAYSRGVA